VISSKPTAKFYYPDNDLVARRLMVEMDITANRRFGDLALAERHRAAEARKVTGHA
jgi:hypothetical protein